MKIHLLGTSHGYAEKNRYQSLTVIETNDSYYLLDAGAPVEYLMVNNDMSFDKIRGIFITHMHNDHAGCLSSVIGPMLRYRYNDKAVCFMPCEEGLEGFLNWLDVMGSSSAKAKKTVKFGVTKEGKVFDDGNISVFARANKHMGGESDSFSYIFELEGKRILFTGDMSVGFPEYHEITRNEHFDIVVCEMAHANLQDVAEALKNTDTDSMYISHYHTPRLKGHEEILKTFPFSVTTAKDGDVITL